MLYNDERLDSKMKSQYACGYVYRYKIDDEELYNEQYQKLIKCSRETGTEECPQPKPSSRTTSMGKRPKDRKEALGIAEYNCELDNNHMTFISRKTGENFVEAHHLIPMKQQGKFKNSIDVPGNIVSLCPNCHRAIHLAEMKQKTDVLRRFYDKRKDKLEKYGIEITFEELLSMYK